MAASLLGTETCKNVGLCSRNAGKNLPFHSAKNKQKIIPSDHKELIRGIVRFKDGLEKSVENYDHLPLPPIYNQVKKLSCQRFSKELSF